MYYKYYGRLNTQPAKTLYIFSDCSALFVAFDAGYANSKTNEPTSIGFAVSNDKGNT